MLNRHARAARRALCSHNHPRKPAASRRPCHNFPHLLSLFAARHAVRPRGERLIRRRHDRLHARLFRQRRRQFAHGICRHHHAASLRQRKRLARARRQHCTRRQQRRYRRLPRDAARALDAFALPELSAGNCLSHSSMSKSEGCNSLKLRTPSCSDDNDASDADWQSIGVAPVSSSSVCTCLRAPRLDLGFPSEAPGRSASGDLPTGPRDCNPVAKSIPKYAAQAFAEM